MKYLILLYFPVSSRNSQIFFLSLEKSVSYISNFSKNISFEQDFGERYSILLSASHLVFLLLIYNLCSQM